MRTLTIAFLAASALAGLSTANAADFDDDYLRGPEYDPVPTQLIDWSGFYIGGHGGYSSGAFGQRNVLQSRLADYFRERDIEAEFAVSKLIALPGSRASGSSYGAFAGYNFQYDDIVIGVEAEYTHYGRPTSSAGSIARVYTTTAGLEENVRLFGQSTTNVEDYGSIRARFGYAFENFMPFLTAGLAVGQVSFTDSVSVQNYGYNAKTYAANQANTTGAPLNVYNHGYTSFNPNYPTPYSSPAGQTQTIVASPVSLTAAARSKTVPGLAFGGGLEYAITSNFLIRGEYQYVQFQDFNGHKAELNTIRGGAAVKF